MAKMLYVLDKDTDEGFTFDYYLSGTSEGELKIFNKYFDEDSRGLRGLCTAPNGRVADYLCRELKDGTTISDIENMIDKLNDGRGEMEDIYALTNDLDEKELPDLDEPCF